ncbi:ABC transporter ATP-binding protein [Verminephrobacter aporrectodeae subsp. tuberculatae]|uniref:ABC transporter ATP-binding protein n=1 Tax=Verminephrobacter aporrectodeae TaxID=1110389 RepID=UPI0002378262|nr:ABC transporter ATP-binding protein [Verminephrobacter aporrectodeae]MCW8166680.1 ABC transporter ATP-binding protein [Verminephrobacter aporrectodeae subsp. tuberculatae]MCW8170906.1 ABC transporter ATP-binding protein [Verminephrobacter aporrectodeae subsp. tuberculatae]MCW8208678.1 ABC transporter ATP-binding protein [Verminephrobacter aporrectodeae subsp. tuberculatae]
MIELRDVVKSYPAGEERLTVLNGVNLLLKPGDFATIAGPSGSGKSTLLHLIGALDKPDRGCVLFDGSDVAYLNDRAAAQLRNRSVGFIFQSFHLIPVISALENVAYPMVLAGVPAAQRRERAQVLLDKVGLTKFAHARPGKLSGGQRQRVAIARSLACSPRLVLADEPTANLDHNTAIGIMDLLLQLNQSEQITFLFSTHDSTVMSYAKRSLRLREGLIVEDPQGQPHV